MRKTADSPDRRPGHAFSRHALEGAVAAFHARHPPRIWSLIVSFLGDAVLPSGGVVQAGVISEFCALADIDPGLVRTALSRLVAKGIVAREREGRKSFYRLTRDERRAFEAAADLIYGRHLPAPDGRWDIALIDHAKDRAKARGAALDAGYSAFGPVTLIRPHHRMRAALAGKGVVSLTADDVDGLDAAVLWPLAELAASYRRFIARYGAFATPGRLKPGEALLARVLLVHDFRRTILRDPFLPAAALPKDWPAGEARAMFDTVHAALSPAAGAWLGTALLQD